MTRRQMLALLCSATVGTRLQAQSTFQQRFFHRKPKPPAPPAIATAFFGTDTSQPGARGIYAAHFNPTTGLLTQPVLSVASLRPSYLAMNRVTFRSQSRTLLYAVNEGDAGTSAISTYVVSAGPNPTLIKLNQVNSAGSGPCYIAVHASGRAAYVADYGGGTIASFGVNPDGSLSEPVDRVDFHKLGHRGPNGARQDAPHPHCATLSPDNRFLVVNDLGQDMIAVFPISPDNPERLGTPNLAEVRPAGAGPRHIAFHPNGRWVYSIDELSSQIDQYLWNSTRGGPGLEAQATLTNENHVISTLANGFSGTNTAAEIVVGPAGSFLYASNRGENSLAVFAVNPETGALTLTQRIACGGKTPRHFTLDPTGRFLICGNQDSSSITVFRRDDPTGHLTGPIQTVPLESPMFTLFL